MMKYCLLLIVVQLLPVFCEAVEPVEDLADVAATQHIRFQAHRGGLREVPENTMYAFERTWRLGGVPEADIRTSSDGVVICLHDSTLKRTTNAPEAIESKKVSALDFEEIRNWDAGAWFDPKHAGEKVPALTEVFESMQDQPGYQIYLDLKKVDLDKLGELIRQYDVGKQIIFCHNQQENLIRFRNISPDVRTMLWIGGKPDEIKKKFKTAMETGFDSLDQIQLHLHRPKGEEGAVSYLLDDTYLRFALKKTALAGVDLETLPFEFDDASLGQLLDLGISWFATDYPQRFVSSVSEWHNPKDAEGK